MLSMGQLRSLSDDELKEISLRKNHIGNATVEANRAMQVRRERSGHWEGVSRKAPSFEGMLIKENGYDGFVKKFK